MESFREAATMARRSSRLVTYVHGDLPASAASSIHETVSRNMGPPEPAEVLDALQGAEGYGRTDKPARARLLRSGEHLRVVLPVFNSEDENSALVTYIQVILLPCLISCCARGHVRAAAGPRLSCL